MYALVHQCTSGAIKISLNLDLPASDHHLLHALMRHHAPQPRYTPKLVNGVAANLHGTCQEAARKLWCMVQCTISNSSRPNTAQLIALW